MFCPNCGANVPDQCHFCPLCATPINRQAQPQPPVAPVKKKTNPAPIIAICVLAGLIVFVLTFLIASSVFSDEDSKTDTKSDKGIVSEVDETTEETSTVNPEYKKVFEDNMIYEDLVVFDTDETASFVIDDENGVEKITIGYNGDKVEYMTNYVYLNIEDYNETQREAVDEYCREEYAELEDEYFVTITYDSSLEGNFYEIKIEFTDLNQTSNVKKMQDWGFVDSGAAIFISAEATEEGLIKNGYIKK